MIKECLVINENGESILFTDFPKGFKSEHFNEIASYYFEDENIGTYHCFKNLGFYDDGYTNKDDDERYLIENGNINYRVGYDEVKKIYDIDIDNLGIET